MIEVEVLRVISKMIVVRRITEESKLSILLNLIKKDVHRVVDDATRIGRCVRVDAWKSEYLRMAAGLYRRLAARLPRKQLEASTRT